MTTDGTEEDRTRELQERLDELERVQATVQKRFRDDPMLSTTAAGGMAVLLPRYIVADLPATPAEGQMAYATDETGGAVPVFADSSGDWRRVTDRTVAS